MTSQKISAVYKEDGSTLSDNPVTLQDAWNSGYLAAKAESSFVDTKKIESTKPKISSDQNIDVAKDPIEVFLLEQGIEYKKNVSLKEVTKRNNAGMCNYFCKPQNLTLLQELVSFFNKNVLSFELIGGSSNVYFLEASKHHIIICTTMLNQLEHKDGMLTCGCGYNLTKLAKYCVEYGVDDYEGFLGIPGTVGGAVVNNSGAFTSEISNVLKKITMLTKDNEIITLTNEELGYSRRNSAFKSKQIKGCILTATFDASNLIDKKITNQKAKDLVLFRRDYIDSDKISLGSVFVAVTFKYFREKYKFRLFLKSIMYFIGKQFIKKAKGKRKLNKYLEFKILGLSRFIDHCDSLNRFYWTKDTLEEEFFDYLNTLSTMSDNTLKIEVEMKGAVQDINESLPFYN
jgi:UDP-N-acetylmuramate dehydrogenase